MRLETPEWVKHAVFYQIFPDRFARSGRVDPKAGLRLKPWGAPPAEQGFQGGDLWGIVDRLDHLERLGVTALYLNPVFASAANHRYHTYDYYEVDPLLGGNEALQALLDAAHGRGMRVVLDGVFNHASRGFWPFHHVLENGRNSPYLEWFQVRDWPLRPYSPDEPHNYRSWAGLPALPKFNVENEEVRDYLLGVARHWVEAGIDGWRLDVPTEIDAPGFWRAFRDTVKAANPEAYLVGEIWHTAEDWLEGDRFDGLMNYPLLAPTLSFFGAGTLRAYRKAHLTFEPVGAPGFADRVERLTGLYDWEATCAQLNLLDSHDMARALWIVGGDTRALRLSVLFLMTMPGAPCIYYGDEIGLAAPGDPHCREAFPWNDEAGWNRDLLDHYRRAIALRHDHEVLRTGRYETLEASGRLFAFRRFFDDPADGCAVVAFNAGASDATLSVDASALPTGPLPAAWPPEGGPALAAGTPVSVPARRARVWAGTG
jgi:neopullulanase